MNILIIGLGSIARKHIAAIREIDKQASIYALRSSPDAPSCDGVTDIYDLDALTGTTPDFAIISNPTSCHAGTIRQLLDLRIPLFIEKPVFESTAYDDLLADIDRAGITTYVACNLRHLSSLGFMHDYIRANPSRRINEVNVYCGSYLPEWRPGTDFRKCYSAIPELGGGVNIDLIHDIDYTCWIFGLPTLSFGLCRNASSLGIPAIDYANYSLIYPGFTASIILNYYRRDYRRRLEVVFEDGTWTLDIKANRITDAEGTVIYEGNNSIADTYTAQLRYFIDMISHGTKPDNGVATAYEILKICLNYERLD